MKSFILKSLLQIIPVLFLISIIVFTLVYISGDPVNMMLAEDATKADEESLREALGLNQPFYIQYLQFLSNIIHGDFGESFQYHTSALSIVLERVPATLKLAFSAMLLTVVVSVPLGVLSALKRNSFWDLVITTISTIGKGAPNFWLGIMFILFFAVKLGWFPASGNVGIISLILPAIALGTSLAARITRLIRSSLLEVLEKEYIRTARSKGLSETVVIFKHALLNSLLPSITLLATEFSFLMGGLMITEEIFAYPGMGSLVVESVNMKDMAVVESSVFVIAIIVILCNLCADILYKVIDPRIEYD